ncbi:MAG: site-specific integrase [Sulfurimonas sp.]|nr:site-specific integrase [Sulfurimonas sp.]
MLDAVKTKYSGIYCKEDTKTKVKTYIARIKITGIINTEQIVGYSNDAIKTNARIAYQKRVELINKLKNGESIKIQDNPTLETYFDNYMQSREDGATLAVKKITNNKSFFKTHIPPHLKNKKIKQITKYDFQNVIHAMVKKGHKPSYIETIKTCFSPIFNDAIERNMVTKNVIKGLKFPDYDGNKYFSLSDEKTKALVIEIMNIANNQYRIMLMFLLRGRRAGEVLSLDWSNIDFENKTYKIKDSQSKIRKTLTFPLDDELIEHFNYLNKMDKGLVFVSPRTGRAFACFPQRVWSSIKKNTGISDMTLHDFRHLLGSTLVNNNVPIEYISRALGHANIATTQRYSNQKELMAKHALEKYFEIVKR